MESLKSSRTSRGFLLASRGESAPALSILKAITCENRPRAVCLLQRTIRPNQGVEIDQKLKIVFTSNQKILQVLHFLVWTGCFLDFARFLTGRLSRLNRWGSPEPPWWTAQNSLHRRGWSWRIFFEQADKRVMFVLFSMFNVFFSPN